MRSNEERIAEVKRRIEKRERGKTASQPDHWHLCSSSKPCADHLSLLFHA